MSLATLIKFQPQVHFSYASMNPLKSCKSSKTKTFSSNLRYSSFPLWIMSQASKKNVIKSNSCKFDELSEIKSPGIFHDPILNQKPILKLLGLFMIMLHPRSVTLNLKTQKSWDWVELTLMQLPSVEPIQMEPSFMPYREIHQIDQIQGQIWGNIFVFPENGNPKAGPEM